MRRRPLPPPPACAPCSCARAPGASAPAGSGRAAAVVGAVCPASVPTLCQQRSRGADLPCRIASVSLERESLAEVARRVYIYKTGVLSCLACRSGGNVEGRCFAVLNMANAYVCGTGSLSDISDTRGSIKTDSVAVWSGVSFVCAAGGGWGWAAGTSASGRGSPGSAYYGLRLAMLRVLS